MPKRYNTPHRSRVVKTRLSEDEYADFTARLAPYGISQSEFLRQAIRRTAIRPIIHVSAVNDELLSAVGKLTAEYGRIGDHIRGLNAGRILDEARRIVADVQRLAAGETVKGAHDSRFFYSVPISRDFLALSTDEDLTRLYTVLPFVKHDICAPEHDGGRFVAIPRDENLNQKIRATAARSSPSVLHQLQQAKKEAAREAAKAATIKKGKGEMTL